MGWFLSIVVYFFLWVKWPSAMFWTHVLMLGLFGLVVALVAWS